MGKYQSLEFPAVGEFVEMSVALKKGKTKDYAYTWYVNEVHQTNEYALNRPNFFRSFNEPGEYAVRVVVSDMKGGVASRTVIMRVGEYQNSKTSSISGIVGSNEGFIQGARVIASKADTDSAIIKHTISMTGNSRDWYLPTGRNNPQKFLMMDRNLQTSPLEGARCIDLSLKHQRRGYLWHSTTTRSMKCPGSD